MDNLWPAPPSGQKYFYYSICLLNPALIQQQIRFSKYTRIVKVRNVTSRFGKYLLGAETIEASNSLREREWNDPTFKSIQGHHNIFPAFAHLGVSQAFPHNADLRRYEHTDFAIQVKFNKHCNLTASEMQVIENQELRTVIMALRLVRLSSIGIIGPVGIIRHIPAGVTNALLRGSRNDPALTNSSSQEKLLELTRSDCRQVQKLFRALESDLPSSVRLALGRLNLSMTRQTVEDQLVDAVVGLEAIYLPKTNSELSYRLSIQVAAHQEVDAKQRQHLFNKTKMLYEMRSKIVHGVIKDISKYKGRKYNKYFANHIALVDFARNILRKGCKDIIVDLSKGSEWEEYHALIESAALTGKTFLP